MYSEVSVYAANFVIYGDNLIYGELYTESSISVWMDTWVHLKMCIGIEYIEYTLTIL